MGECLPATNLAASSLLSYAAPAYSSLVVSFALPVSAGPPRIWREAIVSSIHLRLAAIVLAVQGDFRVTG